MKNKTEKISEYLIKGIKNDLKGVKNLAICFSGSFDSALVTFIAKKYTKSDITLFTIGFRNCYDFKRSNKTAKILGLDKHHYYIKLESFDIASELDDYLNLTNDNDKVSISYTLPLYILLKNIREEYVITGHGADTLFGGFYKYLKSKDLKSDIRSNYKEFIQKLSERELLIAGNTNKKLILPFADKKLAEKVLEFPESYFIKGNERKYLLKLIAEEIGLPRELIYQPKKAIQYSSGIIKELKKIWR